MFVDNRGRPISREEALAAFRKHRPDAPIRRPGRLKATPAFWVVTVIYLIAVIPFIALAVR